MTASVKVLEFCTSSLVQYHMNLLKFYELFLLRRNTLLEGLPDGAMGYVNQSLRNILCCAKCNCRKKTQTYHWKCLPLQLLVFSINTQDGQMHPSPQTRQDKSLTGLPFVFLFS